MMDAEKTNIIENKKSERQEQHGGSRLCEYITGLKSDDPKLIERLREDQGIIRAKYDLPESPLYRYENPSEYLLFLKKLAKSKGIDVRRMSELGDYSERFDSAAVAKPELKQVFFDADETDLFSFTRSIRYLEHEIIHGQQSKEMPFELMEYEAYVAALDLDWFKQGDNWMDLDLFFLTDIYNSVKSDYESRSERLGVKLTPEWDNPEWFLKNVDKVIE